MKQCNEPANVPLAIEPRAAIAFCKRVDAAISASRADIDGEVETDGGCYALTNGVGVVSIVGALGQYGGWWFDGHESVQARLMAAIADPRANAIVVEINSPGGIVAGCFDAVRAVRRAARESGKRLFAFASDAAFSAAYAWACIADEIHLPDSGGVGSIGVLSTMMSWARMNEEMGLDVAVIRSGSQKAAGWPDLPLDPAAIEREQVEVNRLAGIFAAIVSESRPISIEEILSLQGGTVHGADAVATGLADSVTTFEAVLAKAEQAGRARQMQQVAARLGLAPNASEADVIGAITKNEVTAQLGITQAQSERDAEKKKVEALATCAVDLAVKAGIVMVGQRDARLEFLKAMPEAAAREQIGRAHV